jgi:hypothetical protein
MLVVDRRGGTCEIGNLINFDIERKGDVVPHQFEMRMTDQMLYIASRPEEEVIDTEDARAICQ